MNCRQVRRRLSAYQDNELSPSEKQVVEEHVQECSDCADLYLDYEKMDQQLRDFSPPAEPADFTDRVMNEVRAANRHSRWRNICRQGVLAATVLIGVLLGTWLAINLNSRLEQNSMSTSVTSTSANNPSLTADSSPAEPFSEDDVNTLSVRFARAEAGAVGSR